MTPGEELDRLRADWKPPRELVRALPREVQLSGRGIALATLAVLLIFGAFAGYLALNAAAIRDAREAAMLRDQGRNTEAIITRLWRDNDKSRQPWVSYRFPHDGRFYDGKAKAPLGIWRGLTDGSTLAVRFVPTRPELNHPAGWEPSGVPPWVAPVVGGLLAILAALLFFVIGRQKRLLSEGRPAPAAVTHYSRGQHGTQVAHYRFAAAKTIYKGKIGPVRKPPALGSTLCILYDPEKPRRNAAFPLELVKLR